MGKNIIEIQKYLISNGWVGVKKNSVIVKRNQKKACWFDLWYVYLLMFLLMPLGVEKGWF